LFAQLRSGEKFVFEQVAEKVLDELKEQPAIEKHYHNLVTFQAPCRKVTWQLVPVDLQELVDTFCQMQNQITITNGLWATDVPEKFKDHPILICYSGSNLRSTIRRSNNYSPKGNCLLVQRPVR
jgi:hypothetical protein